MRFTKCPIGNEPKMIKGVIYDDVCKHELIDDALTKIEQMTQITDEMVQDYIQTNPMLPELNYATQDIANYFKGMNAIVALTRLDINTDTTHNLIIPKECLSANLVEELEKIDLGKRLIDEYTYRFIESHSVSTEVVEPNDFCGCEEDFLKKNVDKYTKDPVKEGKYFIDGKRVNREEMEAYLQEHPVFASFMSNPFFK